MDDEKYMNLALQEAKKGLYLDEVPIGAIIVYHDEVIASACNQKETLNEVTAHAEILAIRQASDKLGYWHLDDCIMYTTLEPCMMCSGAIIQSRISKVVYGAKSQRWDGLSIYLKTHQFNHYPEVISGVLEKPCMMILSEYFRGKRKK
ncbi:MAG: nucleoside deaminase [Erysipelotrichaceae bacterium]|nr:nucleoside deaminase [Erysipelotrichaceae bacterium]